MMNEEIAVEPSILTKDYKAPIRASIKLSESNGVTSMQFIWQPINPTREEAEAWEASRSQHGKGWEGGFEMLAIYLATMDK